jgi:hypothetical protein
VLQHLVAYQGIEAASELAPREIERIHQQAERAGIEGLALQAA